MLASIPNYLTVLRIILVIPFVVVLNLSAQSETPEMKVLAIAIFVFASLTDFLDGYIARKYNLVSNFGKLMDALADKILVVTALIYFVSLGYISPIIPVVTIFRDFLVNGVRNLAAADGEVIAAGNMGKWKTTTQMIAITVVIWNGASTTGAILFNNILFIVPVILTLWSGIEYTYNGRKHFNS